jgi:ubiquinone biosynthesis protein
VTSSVRHWFASGAVMRRSRQVARVLARHGYGSIVDPGGLGGLHRWRLPGRRPSASVSRAVHLREALGELGVTFIKLGQMLSTRSDLLPPDIIIELARLQDAAPRVPIADIHRTIREDLGADPAECFATFDDVPIASASIGQVHAARLHDGREVVVKVRRPGVMEQVEVDLQILHGIVDWAQEHTPFGRDYDLQPLVEEFAFTLRNELDYVREGENADRFSRAFAEDQRVLVPWIHWKLSTARVLTMQRMTGTKITDLESLDRLGIPRRGIAENAVRVFLREVLDFGFFHGDPHPGNFFIQPDGALAMVDFGMVGRVTEAVQLRLLRAGLSAIQQDPEGLAEELFTLGVAGRRANRLAFQRDLDHVLSRYGGRSLRELSATMVVEELTHVAFRHKLQLPSELALLFRVVTMSEGIGLMLDPEFRYLEYASPFFRRRWTHHHALGPLTRRVGMASLDALELGVDLPRRTGRLLARLERGELELNVHHEGLSAFAGQMQRMTNRLALAVILAASVVALALALGVRGVPDGHTSMTWLFRLGLLFSLLFGAGLLWSMWRAPKR